MKVLEYQATNETIYGFQGSIFQSKLTVFNFIESIFNNESSKKVTYTLKYFILNKYTPVCYGLYFPLTYIIEIRRELSMPTIY